MIFTTHFALETGSGKHSSGVYSIACVARRSEHQLTTGVEWDVFFVYFKYMGFGSQDTRQDGVAYILLYCFACVVLALVPSTTMFTRLLQDTLVTWLQSPSGCSFPPSRPCPSQATTSPAVASPCCSSLPLTWLLLRPPTCWYSHYIEALPYRPTHPSVSELELRCLSICLTLMAPPATLNFIFTTSDLHYATDSRELPSTDSARRTCEIATQTSRVRIESFVYLPLSYKIDFERKHALPLMCPHLTPSQ